MPQDYGDISDWREHFDYLLQAFQDERYIYIDDKPLFIIYRPGHIPDCEKMLNYWNVNVKINMYIFACLSMYKINHFLC